MQQVHRTSSGPSARVGRRKHQPPYPRVDHRTSAHRTRLKRYIQRGVGQSIVGTSLSRCAQDSNLCVRSRVMLADGGIMRGRETMPFRVHQYSAHGHFAHLGCPLGMSERYLHPEGMRTAFRRRWSLIAGSNAPRVEFEFSRHRPGAVQQGPFRSCRPGPAACAGEQIGR